MPRCATRADLARDQITDLGHPDTPRICTVPVSTSIVERGYLLPDIRSIRRGLEASCVHLVPAWLPPIRTSLAYHYRVLRRVQAAWATGQSETPDEQTVLAVPSGPVHQ